MSESPHLPPATTHSAVPSLLWRTAGLAVAVALGWLAVDRGYAWWVQHEEAIVRQMARYVPRPDPERLQPLLAVGEDPLLTVVLACDFAQPACRQRLATLAQWQALPSARLRKEDSADPARAKGEVRRLVFLPGHDAAGGVTLAETLHALDQQGLFWRSLPLLAQDPAVWQANALERPLHAVPFDPQKLARDREDAEIQLQVRVEQTMAQALEVPPDSGLLVAGLPVAATQADGPALAQVLDAAEDAMAANLAFYGGDVGLAHARSLAGLPARTRDRYVRWILLGKKAPSLATAAGLPAEGTATESETEDEDEEP